MTVFSASDSSRLERAAQALRILDAPTIGPHRLYKLLDAHGSLAGVERHLVSDDKVSERVQEHILGTPLTRYRDLMSEVVARGDDFRLWSDADYPANLSLWGARPAVLFFRGDLSHLARRSLALVGRVDPSPEGRSAAHRFARHCVEDGITVVSGLAKGIDAASHRATLEEPPGYTYAVVGHGLDYAYPAENRDLYEAIPQRGAVISQFPLGIGPQKWTFPARNEAMCTLALGTVIVEGRPGCGSIIQAEFSFKHGRPVFLLSRNLRQGDTSWARELVAKGAIVVERFEEVLEVVQETMGELWQPPAQETRYEQGDLLGLLHGPEQTGLPEEGIRVRTTPETALLFDLDGVIADSRKSTAVALATIASRHTGRRVDPQTVDVAGSPIKALAALGVPNSKDIYRAEYDREFAAASKEHMRVFKDAVAGLRALRQAGVHLGAITAQPKRRAERLLPADVKAEFEVFYSWTETSGDKSVGIRKALKALNVPASRAAYIGDSPSDLEAARKAGVLGVGVLWGFSDHATLSRWPHEVMLNDPSELDVELLATLFDD
ncbi:DNA-processing protein DprA [Brachybacterium tyrofermentans]|uniref:DNA-processing protein DprA n=1 Tax=Brachybacterium tyrofermentans TaxID=47848 RepID=UPI003FD6055E